MHDQLERFRNYVQQHNPSVYLNLGNDELAPSLDANVLGKRIDGEDGAYMEDYFTNVGVVKSALNEISRNIEQVRILKVDAIECTDPVAEKGISNSLNKLLDITQALATKTKKALQSMKKLNEELEGDSTKSSEAKIRDNIHQALTRKFKEILTEFQAAQTDYKHDIRQKMTRQIKLVYPDVNDTELREMVDSGEMTSSAAFRMKLSGGHQSLKNAISDMHDKYRDIRRLEQSVSELHQMFVELSVMVEHQGELLNQIEFSVTKAGEYTGKAEQELTIARKHQETAKKRACWISICVIILAIIIIVPIIVVVV